MSDMELSEATRNLLKHAKGETPSAAARAKIWEGVATTSNLAVAGAASTSTAPAAVSGAPVASAAASATSAGAAGATKVLALGAIFGGAVTVGLAVVMLRVGAVAPPPAALESSAPSVSPSAVVSVPMTDAPGLELEARGLSNRPVAPIAPLANAAACHDSQTGARSDLPRGAANEGDVGASKRAVVPSGSASPAALATSSSSGSARARGAVVEREDDALMKEATVIAEARGALVRGDAAGALASVRAASRLPVRALEPEGMALEAQALRALERDDDAVAVEITLRRRFPEHALAR